MIHRMDEPAQTFEGEIVAETELPMAPFPQELKARRGQMRLENVTVEQLEKFFTKLEECGTLYKAANLAGLHYATINRFKKEDEEFRAMLEESMQVYREVLEAEAHRRAIVGWDEPVFSQKTGDRIGEIRRYDSKLLELMLKRHIPEYREKFEGSITVTGGVLVAPISSNDPAAWAAKHAATELNLLATPDTAPELPPE